MRGQNPRPVRFPLRSIFIAVMVTVGLLLVTSWVIWRSYLDYESTLVRDLRLQAYVNIIEDSADVTALAQNISATGDFKEYRGYLQRSSQLNEAVESLSRLTVGDTDLYTHAHAIERENRRLVTIEDKAFDLLHQGKTSEAEELLFGDKYRDYLLAFHNYTDNFEEALGLRIDEDIASLKQKALFAFGVVTGVVPFLLLIWVAILRTAKFHLDERNRMEAELRSMSLHDDLTQLYNRRGFTMLCEQQWLQARRTGRTMLLVFCDLDELKRINDTHGHQWGDEAIRQSARILQETFRESDIIGRVGGDEFVILITEFVDSDVRAVRRRVHKTTRDFNETGELPFRLSISIGFAWYRPDENRTLAEVLAEADATMYEQKKSRPENQMLSAG